MKTVFFVSILASLLFFGCEKEVDTLDRSLLGVKLKNDRLVFDDFEQYHQTLASIKRNEVSDIPGEFRSYNDVIFNKLEKMEEEELHEYILSGEYSKLFMIEVDDEGNKNVLPIISSITYGSILNDDLEYQIGDKIYKLDRDNLYIIDEAKYSEGVDFSTVADEIRPIERRSTDLVSNSRDVTLDDCTTFFLQLSGSWRRKLQGKVLYTGTGSGNHPDDFRIWRVESLSRKKTSLGYWVGTNEYPVQLSGSITLGAIYNNGASEPNQTFNFNQNCGGCQQLAVEYDIYDMTFSAQPIGNVDYIFLVSASGTHRLQCNGDCANEGTNGWVECTTSI